MSDKKKVIKTLKKLANNYQKYGRSTKDGTEFSCDAIKHELSSRVASMYRKNILDDVSKMFNVFYSKSSINSSPEYNAGLIRALMLDLFAEMIKQGDINV